MTPAEIGASARLDGKVAMVTGAGAGMGRAHAILLAERGARVAVHDINRAAADETAALVAKAGAAPIVVIGDLAKPEEIIVNVAEVERTLGRLDILVNNAAIHEFKKLHEMDEASYDRMMAINVTGLFFACQAAAPGMKARGGGRIINIASTAGMVGQDGASHYAASKAAVIGLSRALAKELAPDKILVNCVAPGPIMTDMVIRARGIEGAKKRAETEIPLKRYGDPREVSYLVAFLASDESAFIAGQLVSINGGNRIVGI
jgi:3-oxoacyl-[acyl-carrier protein] reductase